MGALKVFTRALKILCVVVPIASQELSSTTEEDDAAHLKEAPPTYDEIVCFLTESQFILVSDLFF